MALGALGAWIGCRKYDVRFLDFADAAAPGVLIAQALGRWGNWFNNEIYGRPSDAPWAVQIHQWDTATGSAVKDAGGDPVEDIGIHQRVHHAVAGAVQGSGQQVAQDPAGEDRQQGGTDRGGAGYHNRRRALRRRSPQSDTTPRAAGGRREAWQ